MRTSQEHRIGTFRRWIGWAALWVIVDQAAKALVRATLSPGERIPLIDGILFLTFVPNERGFSWFVPDLPAGSQAVFLLVRLILLALAFPVYDFYAHCGQARRWSWVALVALSAGLAGNLLDDLFVPYTTDFLQVWHSPSANFADLFSYAGLGALALEMISGRKRGPWPGLRASLAQAAQTRRAFLAFLKSYFTAKR